ncbi:hypothetical protein GRI89_04765 [Altererythrobacter salegens]|uniref:DUF8021 domain-containing protein n=1 Tax=Croceibacterium salegens TaxID=1737568 RepID=A0A6I4SS96_9SPHN|nr:hypothetical protein [Croceibacterium salegens]MXO58851.1 hypothetical protein [Croceibacterium salegens]
MKVSKIAALVVAAATMATASPAAAQFFGGTCTRAELQEMADKYIKGQTEGLPLYVPMGNWVTYHENGELSTMSQGTFSIPLKVAHHRAALDTDQCKVFLEIVSYESEKPYVIAVQFGARGGNASNFEVISTTKGDWLFDAKYTYEYARREDWSEIPDDKRNTPAELKAAADAYLDLFKDKSVQVPWGTPCNRLEGSVYTNADTCNVGVPDNIDMIDREYVIDPVIGAVDVFLKMGPNKRPDSHLFRIENGKIRFVHTVTNCLGDDNCGFGSFDEMLKKNPQMRPPFKD